MCLAINSTNPNLVCCVLVCQLVNVVRIPKWNSNYATIIVRVAVNVKRTLVDIQFHSNVMHGYGFFDITTLSHDVLCKLYMFAVDKILFVLPKDI